MNNEVLVEEDYPFIRITLNRPNYGNAYNFQTASSLIEIFKNIKKSENIYGVVIAGAGPHLCTGADLHWMSEAAALSHEENLKDMAIIKGLYEEILTLSIPVIVVAKGKVRGGGVGLVAAADIVLSASDTTFALTEARLGLIPGIISPILIAKIGRSRFLEMAISGREISVIEAHALGLVHQIIEPEKIEEALKETLAGIRKSSRRSLIEIKKSLGSIYHEETFDAFFRSSAQLRTTEEFRERYKPRKK
jgi:methylglutaconyl-CoA hydratase